MISENLAREHLEGTRAALGGRIRENPENPWREIVGVVADVHDWSARTPPAIVYLAGSWRTSGAIRPGSHVR